MSSAWRSNLEWGEGEVVLLISLDELGSGEAGGVGKSCSTPWSRREGKGSLIWMWSK